MPDRILTHHVNMKNPRTGKVQTFEPGEQPPQWAQDVLVSEGHVAYPEANKVARAVAASWQASKAATEAMAAINEEQD